MKITYKEATLVQEMSDSNMDPEAGKIHRAGERPGLSGFEIGSVQ